MYLDDQIPRGILPLSLIPLSRQLDFFSRELKVTGRSFLD